MTTLNPQLSYFRPYKVGDKVFVGECKFRYGTSEIYLRPNPYGGIGEITEVVNKRTLKVNLEFPIYNAQWTTPPPETLEVRGGELHAKEPGMKLEIITHISQVNHANHDRKVPGDSRLVKSRLLSIKPQGIEGAKPDRWSHLNGNHAMINFATYPDKSCVLEIISGEDLQYQIMCNTPSKEIEDAFEFLVSYGENDHDTIIKYLEDLQRSHLHLKGML